MLTILFSRFALSVVLEMERKFDWMDSEGTKEKGEKGEKEREREREREIRLCVKIESRTKTEVASEMGFCRPPASRLFVFSPQRRSFISFGIHGNC